MATLILSDEALFSAAAAHAATLGDDLGYADGNTCLATCRVDGLSRPAALLALMDYRGEPGGGAYVALSTSRTGMWNPVTGEEISRAGSVGVVTPQLSPQETTAVARNLEHLAGRAESGYRPAPVSQWRTAARRVQHLLECGAVSPADPICVGDEDAFPLKASELLSLLKEKDPGAGDDVRRKVYTKDMADAGGDDGTVWLDLHAGTGDTVGVVVAALEGRESPDTEYNRRYWCRLSPAGARRLAGELRRYARSAQQLRDEHR